MRIDDILSRLHKVSKSGNGWVARCPAHDDTTPSLSIAQNNDGVVLFNCHTGCSAEAVAGALNLEMHDLFSDSEKPAQKETFTESARYKYFDVEGRHIYDKVRYAGTFGGKKFLRDPAGAETALYGSYSLPSATGCMILLSESEKDADSMMVIDNAISLSSGGASVWKEKWTDAIAHVQPAGVTICEHNDTAGKKFSEKVAFSLSKKGIEVRVLSFEGPPGYDVADAFVDGLTKEELFDRIEKQPIWSKNPEPEQAKGHWFRTICEDHYSMDVPEYSVSFDIDRLYRKREDLVGQLTVKCGLAGAKTIDDVLHVANFNLCSDIARTRRTKILKDRAKADEIDWDFLLEEFAQNVLQAERVGMPASNLSTAAQATPDDVLSAAGLTLPRNHPSILFGDGGSAKSYIALYFIGELARRGMKVAYFDWELDEADQASRLHRIYGDDKPDIVYARCERPLVDEMDRLRRIVQEERIQYAVFDSIGAGCFGAPEAAEVAQAYLRATRQVCPGSVHVAHVSKTTTEEADKPFGSVFWHNGARSTWFIKRAESEVSSEIEVAMLNRKANLGPLCYPAGLTVSFSGGATTFTDTNLHNIPELAEKLSIAQRIKHELQDGSLSRSELADRLDQTKDSVKKAIQRHRRLFVNLPGGKVGLSH